MTRENLKYEYQVTLKHYRYLHKRRYAHTLTLTEAKRMAREYNDKFPNGSYTAFVEPEQAEGS